MAETRLHPAELVLPVFVREGIEAPVPISAMPGVVQHSLDSFRAESSDDPFWRGVKRIEPAAEHVEVEFHEPIDPRPLQVGESLVECHLYDEEALEKAEEARQAQPRAEVVSRPSDSRRIRAS